MSEQTTIVDTDGGQEAAASRSRRAFLGLGAAACGAALVLGQSPSYASTHGDVHLLVFLHQVEELQLSFFNLASISGLVSGLKEGEGDIFHAIAHHDQEHVRWIEFAVQKLGQGEMDGKGPSNLSDSSTVPTFQFADGTFEHRDHLYAAALEIKEIAVGAYQGAIARATKPDLIQAIAALAGVEGRHLALLREKSGSDPFVPYEAALAPHEVAHRLRGYGFASEVI